MPGSDPPPASAPLSDEQEILAAYQGYWDTWLKANNPPNPNHPDLEKYATGAALERDRSVISQNAVNGTGYRLPDPSIYAHRAALVSTGLESATVSDCATDDGIMFNVATNQTLNSAIGTQQHEVTLVLVDGSWRVSRLRQVGHWVGVNGCARP